MTLSNQQIAALCGAHEEVMRGYVASLKHVAAVRGFIGPGESNQLWSRHIANCAVTTQLLCDNATVCDVGSGAGLPGIVIAILRPDLKITCVESMAKRCHYLRELTEELNLSNVSVIHSRAEELKDCVFDYVTARAVAPLIKLVRQAGHLVQAGGQLIAIKGKTVGDEIDNFLADKVSRSLGPCRLLVIPDVVGNPVNIAVITRKFDVNRGH